MFDHNEISKIKSTIARGGLAQAIASAKELLHSQGSSKLDDIINLESQLIELKQKVSNRTISQNEEVIHRNQIRNSLLSILKEVHSTGPKRLRKRKAANFSYLLGLLLLISVALNILYLGDYTLTGIFNYSNDDSYIFEGSWKGTGNEIFNNQDTINRFTYEMELNFSKQGETVSMKGVYNPIDLQGTPLQHRNISGEGNIDGEYIRIFYQTRKVNGRGKGMGVMFFKFEISGDQAFMCYSGRGLETDRVVMGTFEFDR